MNRLKNLLAKPSGLSTNQRDLMIMAFPAYRQRSTSEFYYMDTNIVAPDQGIYISSFSLLYKMDLNKKTVLWQQEIEGLGTSQVVVNNVVYAYSFHRDSNVYAFSADDGSLIWQTRVEDYRVENAVQLNELLSLTVADGYVYVNSRCGVIYVLDMADGVLRWTCRVPFTESVSVHLGALGLTVVNGILYLSCENGLYAVDTTSCTQLWCAEISEEQVFYAHYIHNGTLYACADQDPEGCTVYAFSICRGSLLWSSELIDDPIFDPPVVVQNYVYCTGANHIYALDASDGSLVWCTYVGLTNYLQPRVVDDLLYIGLVGSYQPPSVPSAAEKQVGTLLALNTKDGSLRWLRTVKSCPIIQCVDHGNVYISVMVGHDIYAFDACSGEQLWHFSDPHLDLEFSSTHGYGACTIIVP